MFTLVDTHCHLFLNTFQEDLEVVLERAWSYGINRILIPGIDLNTSRQAVKITNLHPNLFAAIGVHPNDALSWKTETISLLKQLSQQPKVVALGEIGLDYYYHRAPKPLQQEVFKAQLELAAELSLPVIIHNRQSVQDLWPLLKKWQEDLVSLQHPLMHHPGVLHSYEGNIGTALDAIDHNFLIGVSGPITFQNAIERRNVIHTLSLNHILLETDSPFLAPHPYRGHRNEPCNILLIAEQVADLHGLPLHTIADTTSRNSDRLFSWKAII